MISEKTDRERHAHEDLVTELSSVSGNRSSAAAPAGILKLDWFERQRAGLMIT
jgi:hypothetical protein